MLCGIRAAAFLLMMVVGDFFAVHKIRHIFCLPTGKVRFPPFNFNLATYFVFSCKFILCFFSFHLDSSARVFWLMERN